MPLSTGWEVQINSISDEDARMGYVTSSGAKVYVENPIEIYFAPRAAEGSDNDADCEVPHLCEDDIILFVIGADTAFELEESNNCTKLTVKQLAGLAADIDNIIIPNLAIQAAQGDAAGESA